MKGKRKLTQRILSLLMVFAMVMGMLLEPVQIYAAQPGEDAGQMKAGPADPQPDGNGGTTDQGGTPGGNSGETTPQYTITVTADKNEAKVGETVGFTASIKGTAPDDDKITWSADNGLSIVENVADNKKATVTIPSTLKNDTTVTVTATCGEVSGTATFTAKIPTYTVSGTVSANNKPIQNATVKLGDFELTTTDETGSYSVTQVPNGTYGLSVQCEGFQAYTGSITVTDSEVTNANVSMNLDTVSASIAKGSIVVGEKTSVSVSPQVEVGSVNWSSSQANIAAVDAATGEVTGIKAGTATITPTITSKYGNVPANGIQVTIGECETKITEVSVNKTGLFAKKLKVDVTIASITGNNTPTGGNVQFTLQQEDVDEVVKPIVKEVELKDGKATLELTKKNLDFSGKYTITVQYLGNPDYYKASNTTIAEYNYKVGGLIYRDEQDKDVTTNNVETPMILTYGEEKTIWVEEGKEGVVNEVIANASGNISITKQEKSQKTGYTEFLVKATQAGEDPCSATFKKTDGDETFHSKLYVSNRRFHYIGKSSFVR